MKLRNVAVLLCATSALLYACGSDDDSAPSGGAGAGGKSTAGAGGKASAGASGKAGAAAGGADTAAGTGNEAGDDAGGVGNAPGAAGNGGEGGEGGAAVVSKKFTVTLENVATAKAFTSSGIFDTPVGKAVGAAGVGDSYTFTVDVGRKQTVHFATMLAATNDLFFAPDGLGIAVYDKNTGAAIETADVTSQVHLWDAGTELNQEPHEGSNTVTKQAAANTGAAENANVLPIADAAGFAFDYTAAAAVIKVGFVHISGTQFKFTITNLTTATTLVTSGGTFPVPLSRGVWVVSSAANPLFTVGQKDYGFGLEHLAEDGDPASLGAYAAANSGITYPASPGAWLLHTTGTKPLFTAGVADAGKGIEAIAEDGDPSTLGGNLASLSGYLTGAVFNIPVGKSAPSAIVPGGKYQFTFTASPGESLSFATMLAATNDVFFAPAAAGIPLFDANGEPVTGDVSAQVSLWDAGTEGNEEPGIGPNTVTNQLPTSTAAAGEGKVQLLSAVPNPSAYVYPTAQSVLKVTLAAE